MSGAQPTGCSECMGEIGLKIPDDETGTWAFDDVGSARVCVTNAGDVIVHYPGVEEHV